MVRGLNDGRARGPTMLHRTSIGGEWREASGLSQTSNPSGGRDMVGRRARADVAQGVAGFYLQPASRAGVCAVERYTTVKTADMLPA